MAGTYVPHVSAAPAGAEPQRVAVRAGEDRSLLIDCSDLLAAGERIESVGQAQVQPTGLRLMGQPSVRPGGLIEVPIRAPSAADIKTWRDFGLTARLRTNRGQALVAAVTVRVHKE